MTLKTDHIVYPTWDAAACLKFYRDVMGFTLANTACGNDWGGFPWLMLFFRAGDGREVVRVALRGVKRPKSDELPRDVRHLAFAEKSVIALQRWRQKLLAAKIVFWEETHGRQSSIYFEDPDGTILEITAPPTRSSKITNRAALLAARKWIKECHA
ncbi:MAG TPA: VOC family protein [Rhizomicrobium sp.]|nr:VOC family protein [Rhizomicrobium sp.]